MLLPTAPTEMLERWNWMIEDLFKRVWDKPALVEKANSRYWRNTKSSILYIWDYFLNYLSLFFPAWGWSRGSCWWRQRKPGTGAATAAASISVDDITISCAHASQDSITVPHRAGQSGWKAGGYGRETRAGEEGKGTLQTHAGQRNGESKKLIIVAETLGAIVGLRKIFFFPIAVWGAVGSPDGGGG